MDRRRALNPLSPFPDPRDRHDASLTRRRLLERSALVAAAPLLPLQAFAQERRFEPQPGAWRTFDLVTTVNVAEVLGTTRLWLPIPDVASDRQQPIENSWSGNAARARIVADRRAACACSTPSSSPPPARRR